MNIARGTANTFDITVTERVSLTNPYFLFEFTNEATSTQNTCIASNTSSYTRRYDRFSITESGTEDRVNGTLTLAYAGFWRYRVFEQSSSTNLTVTANLTLLEEGICRVTDTSIADTYIEQNNADTYVE